MDGVDMNGTWIVVFHVPFAVKAAISSAAAPQNRYISTFDISQVQHEVLLFRFLGWKF